MLPDEVRLWRRDAAALRPVAEHRAIVLRDTAFVHRPERLLNMHWLNPAYLIPVVELSTHAGTDAAVVARTRALMQDLGKLPALCGPTPGYIVPRLQALVMNEVARMVEQGRLGLKSGSGFYEHAGRDAAAYRLDVLARTLALLRQQGLWREPAPATL